MKLQNGFKTNNSHFSPEIMPALFFRPCEIWPHPASDRTLYTHGGSWMFGSPDTDSYAQLGSRLAKVNGSSWRYLGYLHDIPSLWYLHDLIYRDKKIEMIWHLYTFIMFRYEWKSSEVKGPHLNFSWRLNIGWFTHDTYTGTMWLDVQIIFRAKLQILQHTSTINCWDRWLALWWCSQTIL